MSGQQVPSSRIANLEAIEVRLQQQLRDNASLRAQIAGMRNRTLSTPIFTTARANVNQQQQQQEPEQQHPQRHAPMPRRATMPPTTGPGSAMSTFEALLYGEDSTPSTGNRSRRYSSAAALPSPSAIATPPGVLEEPSQSVMRSPSQPATPDVRPMPPVADPTPISTPPLPPVDETVSTPGAGGGAVSRRTSLTAQSQQPSAMATPPQPQLAVVSAEQRPWAQMQLVPAQLPAAPSEHQTQPAAQASMGIQPPVHQTQTQVQSAAGATSELQMQTPPGVHTAAEQSQTQTQSEQQHHNQQPQALAPQPQPAVHSEQQRQLTEQSAGTAIEQQSYQHPQTQPQSAVQSDWMQPVPLGAQTNQSAPTVANVAAVQHVVPARARQTKPHDDDDDDLRAPAHDGDDDDDDCFEVHELTATPHQTRTNQHAHSGGTNLLPSDYIVSSPTRIRQTQPLPPIRFISTRPATVYSRTPKWVLDGDAQATVRVADVASESRPQLRDKACAAVCGSSDASVDTRVLRATTTGSMLTQTTEWKEEVAAPVVPTTVAATDETTPPRRAGTSLSMVLQAAGNRRVASTQAAQQRQSPSPSAPDVLDREEREWVHYVEELLQTRKIRCADAGTNTDVHGTLIRAASSAEKPSTEFYTYDDVVKLKDLCHEYERMVLTLTDALDARTTELKNASDLNTELRETLDTVEKELEVQRIRALRASGGGPDAIAKDELIKKLQEELDTYEAAVTSEWQRREKRHAHEIASVGRDVAKAKDDASEAMKQLVRVTHDRDDVQRRQVQELHNDVTSKELKVQELLAKQRELSLAILQKQDDVSKLRLALLERDDIDIDNAAMHSKFHALVEELKAEYLKLYEERSRREQAELTSFYHDAKAHMDQREVICNELSAQLQEARVGRAELEQAHERDLLAVKREGTLQMEELNAALMACMTQLEHKTRQVGHLMEILNLHLGYQEALEDGLKVAKPTAAAVDMVREEHEQMVALKDREIRHLRETLESEVHRQAEEARSVQVQLAKYARTIEDLERQVYEAKRISELVGVGAEVAAEANNYNNDNNVVSPRRYFLSSTTTPMYFDQDKAKTPYPTQQQQQQPSTSNNNYTSPAIPPPSTTTTTTPFLPHTQTTPHLPSTSRSTLYDLLYRSRD